MSRCFPVFAILAFSTEAIACSFRQYTMFPPVMPWETSANAAKLEAPSIEYEVRRGVRRENGDSCADTGVLTLKVRSNEYSAASTGYLIEVLESADDEIVFPDHPISAQGSESVYSFPWLDGATKVQEPLNVLVRITLMDSDGKRSEPVLVEVIHHGYL